LAKIEAHLRKGADVRFDIKRRIPIAKETMLSIGQPFSAQTRVTPADFSALLDADVRQERVFVSISYAELPANNDFFVRVFINLPGANAQTPTDDSHYAGSFAFFGTHTGDHAGHPHKTDFLVNVTDTLQGLKRIGAMRAGDPIAVQLVAVPATRQFVRPEMQLMLKDIDLLVSPVSVRSK
jgi:tyrosinase